ncbi:hypothetical protein IP90_02599 [Luteimonas cucumeris]|uniref:Uncharacterized protein n=1 Tax=Luteimonas cucumeris TaxID=985012 RepID=A0A562L023_9GAMM|nr:hypothetical protein IP90_02599 [Luteimonas cucumeris]
MDAAWFIADPIAWLPVMPPERKNTLHALFYTPDLAGDPGCGEMP